MLKIMNVIYLRCVIYLQCVIVSRIHRLFSPFPWKTIDQGSTVFGSVGDNGSYSLSLSLSLSLSMLVCFIGLTYKDKKIVADTCPCKYNKWNILIAVCILEKYSHWNQRIFLCWTYLNWLYIHSFIHSFHWHVQNSMIPCCSQELLPFLSVMYFFLPPFSTTYSSILSHLILPSISWSTTQSCCSQIHI